MHRTIALFTLSISFVFPVIALADAEQIETPPPPPIDEMASMIPPRTQSVSVMTFLEMKPDIVSVDGVCNFIDTFPSQSAARSAITDLQENLRKSINVKSRKNIAFRVSGFNIYTSYEPKLAYNANFNFSIRITDPTISPEIDLMLMENGCSTWTWAPVFRRTSQMKRAALRELLPIARDEAAMYGEFYGTRFTKITSIDVQVTPDTYVPVPYDPSTNTSLVNATLNVTFEEEPANPANR